MSPKISKKANCNSNNVTNVTKLSQMRPKQNTAKIWCFAQLFVTLQHEVFAPGLCDHFW